MQNCTGPLPPFASPSPARAPPIQEDVRMEKRPKARISPEPLPRKANEYIQFLKLSLGRNRGKIELNSL
ncbi:hypothetical protein N186_01190 [Thermofilum adornatum]|uniref:Uncharacterized protein n=2 Tax=Thermofilum adornatum TaxID=1365176 RepID=S5ZUI1_9CREN|nr:hypothetical protein [Thermofilum adornatum]AGT34634.1 hypothetical protein N186_01190 [Thermofilum adornatum]AJB42370.1 hypothetical protein TCARB_1324 [Thermofilum adornatum 1505]